MIATYLCFMHQVLMNIKAIRELKGYSQESIADELGITQSKYGRFENGGKKIDFQMIEEVAQVFEMDVYAIIAFHKERDFSSDGVNDLNENYKLHSKDLAVLREKIKYLEQVNEVLTQQLHDKQEIIELLKKERQ